MDERRQRFEAQALPHLDAAYNLARWLARQPAEAEDIVQEAMLRAFRAFDGFRGSDARPWLLAIVRNCWRDAGAAARRRAEAPLEAAGDPADSAAPDPEAAAIAAGEGRKLETLLKTLPPEYREVLILREMEEMSYRDIAEITKTPIGTVMSRLARSRALLRERWLAEMPR